MRVPKGGPGIGMAFAWGLALSLAVACGPQTPATGPGGGPSGPATVQLSVTAARLVAPGIGWIAEGQPEAGFRLYRTLDAGSTWARVDLPSSGDYLYRTEFLGRDDVLVVLGPGKVPGQQPTTGFALYATVDGGATWRQISPPGLRTVGFVQPLVDFVDPSHGWYLDMPQQGSEPTTLFRTADGGAHWETLLTVPGPGRTAQGLAYPAFGAGIAFVDATTGWISSNRTLFGTRDGGRTWQRRTLTWPADTSSDARLQPPQFVDSWGVVAAVDYRSPDRYPEGNCFTHTWETNDGGITWTGPVQPASAGGGPALFSVVDRGHRFMAPPPSAARQPGALYTWSGSRWAPLAVTGLPPYGSFVDLQFLNTLDGWAVITTPDTGGQSLVSTGDGGRSWSVVTTPTPTVQTTPFPSVGK